MEIAVGDVAVITGAGSGIGRSLAFAFADKGCDLMLADIEADALDRVTAELAVIDRPVRVATRIVDVADPAAVDAFAAATIEEFGRVNIVCNNAGVAGGGNTWELSVDDWKWVLGVNLWGVINGVRAFVPHLIEAGRGHVVNTASIAGLLAAPGMAHYNATKHAVIGLSETLYRELAALEPAADGSPISIGVSVLCPSWVNTRIYLAERNRPVEFNDGKSPDQAELAAIEELAGAFFDEAMSPEEVAAKVVEAVENNQYWILTHSEMNDAVRDRFDRASRGINPPVENPFAI